MKARSSDLPSTNPEPGRPAPASLGFRSQRIPPAWTTPAPTQPAKSTGTVGLACCWSLHAWSSTLQHPLRVAHRAARLRLLSDSALKLCRRRWAAILPLPEDALAGPARAGQNL